jgi:NhaP-type Na+/H+ or K+/H+ antiporter
MSGAILGGVSAAVAIPLVKSMGVRDPWGTALVMESALGDVLCIVILLGLVQAFVSGQMAPARIVGAVISSLFMASVIGVLGGIGWMLVLNQVRQFPNTAFTTLAAVFILYGVADELGFSGAITALAFGATLANHRLFSATGWELFSESRLARIEHGDMSFFLEVLFLLKTFFFVYLGMSIHFKDLNLLLWAGVFCGVVYTLRLLVVKVTFSGSEANLHERSLASVMVPKGLVSAVLAGIPVDAGIPGAEAVQEFTYMVVLWSIFATAVLIPLQDRSLLRPFYRWVLGGEETA